MYPVLLKIGPIPIHTYGFMIAIGFLVAVYVIRTLAARSKLDVDRTLDLTFWSLLVGFAGARALFVFTQFDRYISDPLGVFKIWEGGLVFLGGPIAVLPFAIWYVKKFRIPTWRTFDCMIPGLVIAHMFGRFGCVAAGCCYGRPTGETWGFKFHSDLVEPGLHGIPLHPVQMYEASALFILFSGLIYLHRKKLFDGQVVLTYFMAYPIIRSVVETFRGDLVRGFVIDGLLSTSQFLSGLVLIGASGFLVYRLKQLRSQT